MSCFSRHPIISINTSNLTKYGQLGTSKQAVRVSGDDNEMMRVCKWKNGGRIGFNERVFISEISWLFFNYYLFDCQYSVSSMKRRRTRTPSDAGSPPQEKKTVKSSTSSNSSAIKDGPSKSSDAQNAANLEEVEVEKRTAESDVKSFEKGTEEIRKLVAEIQGQKFAVSIICC